MYIVCKKSYQYNDEIYAVSEGGKPTTVYDTEEAAREKADELNAMEFDGLEVGAYAYSYEDITDLSREELSNKLNELVVIQFGEDSNFYDLTIPEGLSKETLHKIANIFNKLKFYEVEEAECG